MANEGEFPKVDGDISYASEGNRFAGAGRTIFIGSTGVIGSATAIRSTGSVLIAAGSLTNPAHIMIDYRVDKNSRADVILSVSGASANATVTLGSTAQGHVVGGATVLVGSPFKGLLEAFSRGMLLEGKDLHRYNALDDLDTTEPVVIDFSLGSQSSANGQFALYSIQSFRNSM